MDDNHIISAIVLLMDLNCVDLHHHVFRGGSVIHYLLYSHGVTLDLD